MLSVTSCRRCFPAVCVYARVWCVDVCAVVPAAAAGDDGFAFNPPVPPTANGSLGPGAARKQLFGPVLSQLRGLMIARMAKPEVRFVCLLGAFLCGRMRAYAGLLVVMLADRAIAC